MMANVRWLSHYFKHRIKTFRSPVVGEAYGARVSALCFSTRVESLPTWAIDLPNKELGPNLIRSE